MQILGCRKYRKMRKRGKAGFNPAEKKKEMTGMGFRANRRRRDVGIVFLAARARLFRRNGQSDARAG